MQLTNAKVEEVKKVKEGEGQYGPWTLYRLKIGGKQYGYIIPSNKPAPVSGSTVDFVEYEETTTQKDGKTYTNLSIKKIVEALHGQSPGESQEHSKSSGNNCSRTKEDPIWYCLSYVKDLQVARIHTDAAIASAKLSEIVEEVLIVGMDFYKRATEQKETSEKFLKAMRSLKDSLGKIGFLKEYDTVLTEAGYLTEDEITDPEKQKAVYTKLRDIYNSRLKDWKESQQQPADNDIPF